MIERYNRYAKYETQNHLRRFIASDKFCTTMSNSLIAYDKVLKQSRVELVLCDHFMEGAYVASENKIMLCSNALMKRKDFENAMKRMLIKMYD
jgi:hypothetical protein